MTALAQQKSAKRGIGWDEKTQHITNAPIEKMLPGVSWFYNWGATPTGNATNLGTADGMGFAPMCWNGNFNEKTIRDYISSHRDGVKYLLGFNEPNFSAQSNMTPEQAAEKWPKVEKIAEDFGLTLVAPALNFTNEVVGGKKWGIYEWLEEFIKVYKEKNNGNLPKMDCLALHCYMNWYGSNTWFATEYFYKDLYEVNKDNNVVGKYPNIVELLDTYKAANGHFPKMMLTEFCSWENDGNIKSVDFQIDQMTQKLQKLEQSDLVEGYAWFMANTGRGESEYPYMSVFKSNTPNSELSTLGKVYVHMSSFDMEKYYATGEMIQAKDYVDASTDNQQVKLRPNTEEGSNLPLQVEMQAGAYPTYQIEASADGEYKITMHIKSPKASPIWVYFDGFKNPVKTSGVATGNDWADYEIKANIKAGKHTVIIYNAGSNSFLFNSWKFESIANGIENIPASTENDGIVTAYSLDGVMMGQGSSLQEMNLKKGIYIIVKPTGERMKSIIK